jgi:hypothetical protein
MRFSSDKLTFRIDSCLINVDKGYVVAVLSLLNNANISLRLHHIISEMWLSIADLRLQICRTLDFDMFKNNMNGYHLTTTF